MVQWQDSRGLPTTSLTYLDDPVDRGLTILALWSSPSRPGSDNSELGSGDKRILQESISILGEHGSFTWPGEGAVPLLSDDCSRKSLFSFSNSILRRFSSDRCFFVTRILVSSPSNVHTALRRWQLSQGQLPLHLIFCRRHRRHLVSIVFSGHHETCGGRGGGRELTHLPPAFLRDCLHFHP